MKKALLVSFLLLGYSTFASAQKATSKQTKQTVKKFQKTSSGEINKKDSPNKAPQFLIYGSDQQATDKLNTIKSK